MILQHKLLISSLGGGGDAEDGGGGGLPELVTGGRDGEVRVWDRRREALQLCVRPSIRENAALGT